MTASHPTRLPRWFLATPLAVLLVLPVGAADLRPKRHASALVSALAQVPVAANQQVPPTITALEETARAFYERGDYQKALEVMQKVT
jgi:hypothetical protein